MWDSLFDFIGGGLSDIGSKASSWLSEGLANIPKTVMSADFLLPAALAGGGLYMQNKALKDAQNAQNAEIERGMAEQRAMQVPITNVINQQTYDYSTPQVQQETDRIKVKLAGGLDDYIGAARESFPEEARAGRVSSDYTTGLSTMKADESARRSKLNSAWANLMAPTQQQFEQGVRDTGYGSRINNAVADSGVLANATMQRAQQITPSGGMMLGGQLANTLGTGMAVNSLLKPKPSARLASWMTGGSYNPDN